MLLAIYCDAGEVAISKMIHVNDNHDVVFHSNIKLFVDDVALYKSIS